MFYRLTTISLMLFDTIALPTSSNSSGKPLTHTDTHTYQAITPQPDNNSALFVKVNHFSAPSIAANIVFQPQMFYSYSVIHSLIYSLVVSPTDSLSLKLTQAKSKSKDHVQLSPLTPHKHTQSLIYAHTSLTL